MRAELRLLRRLEAHAVDAWPATVTERVDGGWVLRATPGLDRGRSNHALPPCRPLWADEVAGGRSSGLRRSPARTRSHPGIQVSPLSLHGTLQAELDRRGWGTRWPVLVLAALALGQGVRRAPGRIVRLSGAEHATPAVAGCVGAVRAGARRGRRTPRRCSRGSPAGPRSPGSRTTPRSGSGWTATVWSGLFCLAVDPARRRSRLGTAWSGALLAGVGARTSPTSRSRSATRRRWRCTERLGFDEAYRYCHRVAPELVGK